MLKKNCSNCDRRIDRKFNFCPWCGNSTRQIKKEDYGLLGQTDKIEQPNINNAIPIAGGIGTLFNHLTQQLTKELQNLNLDEGDGNGIEIRFSTGMAPERRVSRPRKIKSQLADDSVSSAEKERRKKLPLVPVESKIRRLPEGIIYELSVPGVKSKKDVSILRVEKSIEVRAYAKDKCYIKNIPIKAEAMKYAVREEKVFVQIKI